MGVMEEKDLTSIKERILETAAENNFEILELAAALMQMSIGDEPEEIKEEKPLFDRERAGRSARQRRDPRASFRFRPDERRRYGSERGERQTREGGRDKGRQERDGRRERQDRRQSFGKEDLRKEVQG